MPTDFLRAKIDRQFVSRLTSYASPYLPTLSQRVDIKAREIAYFSKPVFRLNKRRVLFSNKLANGLIAASAYLRKVAGGRSAEVVLNKIRETESAEDTEIESKFFESKQVVFAMVGSSNYPLLGQGQLRALPESK